MHRAFDFDGDVDDLGLGSVHWGWDVDDVGLRDRRGNRHVDLDRPLDGVGSVHRYGHRVVHRHRAIHLVRPVHRDSTRHGILHRNIDCRDS